MYLVKTNIGDKFLNSANEVKSINKNDIMNDGLLFSCIMVYYHKCLWFRAFVCE